jgi:hypothetical protein
MPTFKVPDEAHYRFAARLLRGERIDLNEVIEYGRNCFTAGHLQGLEHPVVRSSHVIASLRDAVGRSQRVL